MGFKVLGVREPKSFTPVSGPILFTEEGFTMAATVVGTLPIANPGVVSSTVTIVETTSTGVVLAPASYTITPPTGSSTNGGTFTFTAGIGSSLVASQVDTNAAGLQGPAFVSPAFVVTNPAPLAPVGPITFVVTSVTP